MSTLNESERSFAAESRISKTLRHDSRVRAYLAQAHTYYTYFHYTYYIYKLYQGYRRAQTRDSRRASPFFKVNDMRAALLHKKSASLPFSLAIDIGLGLPRLATQLCVAERCRAESANMNSDSARTLPYHLDNLRASTHCLSTSRPAAQTQLLCNEPRFVINRRANDSPSREKARNCCGLLPTVVCRAHLVSLSLFTNPFAHRVRPNHFAPIVF